MGNSITECMKEYFSVYLVIVCYMTHSGIQENKYKRQELISKRTE